MAYVIAEGCIDLKDRACVDECPVDCIYEGPRKLYIHPDECVDCGACEPVCPVQAIYHEQELPAGSARFAAVEAEVFLDLGSPGGSRGTAPLAADHPVVAEA